MKRSRQNQSGGWPVVMLLAIALVSFSPAAQAQDEPPVGFDFNVAGTLVPGSVATVAATITINDGSTLESINWTQAHGVPVTFVGGAMNETVRLRLGNRNAYRGTLIDFLSEAPVGPDQLPPNVPIPSEEFYGGLQDRFEVVGINPFALEEAGLVELEVEVVTTSGTYTAHAEVHTTMPWRPTAGIRNVPIGVPVILHGKEQANYRWRLLSKPEDSRTIIASGNTKTPEFTPDVPGIYEVRVRDLAANAPVTLPVYVGNWRGMIVAQDQDGRPVTEDLCVACHRSGFAPNIFDDWALTGHAEAFSSGLDTNSHFSERCFGCHAVGFDPEKTNGGMDEAEDFDAFVDAGLLSNPGDNWTEMLDEFPATAQMANIQCENCHGPQSSEPRQDTLAHGWRSDVTTDPRKSLSSDVCATCHGEPMRHGRFQQWQLSGHANYEVATDLSQSGSCARCHTVNGFLEWLPVLTGEVEGDINASVNVSWTPDESHPQTCVTCHDPHNAGTTSGINTDAPVRIQGDTPELIAGFQVLSAGRGALCMTCHNSRRGLRNDENFAETVLTDSTRAPHGSAQTDVLMGENAYGINTGVRGPHSMIEDTCVQCHMEQTPPPDVLSYNQSGTNHTFFASNQICTNCHEGIDVDTVQNTVNTIVDHTQGVIEDALMTLLAEQFAAGFSVDFNGDALVDSANNVVEIIFGEFRGRQSMEVRIAGQGWLGPFRMSDIDVVRPAPLGTTDLYSVAPEGLIKAGWNWNLVVNDGSSGVHNPKFVLSALDAARDALGDRGGPRSRTAW